VVYGASHHTRQLGETSPLWPLTNTTVEAHDRHPIRLVGKHGFFGRMYRKEEPVWR
jgi:hypothetical protein